MNRLSLPVILTVVAVFWLLPLVMLVLSAIRSTSDFYAKLNLFSIPEKIQWSNFTDAWTDGNLGRYLFNGIRTCLIKVPLGVLISSMCAFRHNNVGIKPVFSAAIHRRSLIQLLWDGAEESPEYKRAKGNPKTDVSKYQAGI